MKEKLSMSETTDPAQAERWLFDLVSGLANGPNDWQRIAEQCQLLEPLAREIVSTVLSKPFINRVAESGL